MSRDALDPADVRAIAERFTLGVEGSARGPTVEASIERANAWARALFDAGGETAVVAAFADFFEGHEGDAIAVKLGLPATIDQLSIVEERFGPLPPSYRAFLETYGSVTFLGAFDRATTAPGALIEETDAYDEILEATFAEYDDIYDPAFESGPDWRAWEIGGTGGMFPPEQLEGRAFLRICRHEWEHAYLMALHLRGSDGESPIFISYTEESEIFYKSADSFLAWFGTMVDLTIAEVTIALLGDE